MIYHIFPLLYHINTTMSSENLKKYENYSKAMTVFNVQNKKIHIIFLCHIPKKFIL